jgi:DNA-directed RNA polymerase sigma subunit (sigma70/sigma32)
MTIKHTLATRDVAQRMGVSAERVRQLDSVLRPIRSAGLRRYDPAIVDRVIRQRQTRKVA